MKEFLKDQFEFLWDSLSSVYVFEATLLKILFLFFIFILFLALFFSLGWIIAKLDTQERKMKKNLKDTEKEIKKIVDEGPV